MDIPSVTRLTSLNTNGVIFFPVIPWFSHVCRALFIAASMSASLKTQINIVIHKVLPDAVKHENIQNYSLFFPPVLGQLTKRQIPCSDIVLGDRRLRAAYLRRTQNGIRFFSYKMRGNLLSNRTKLHKRQPFPLNRIVLYTFTYLLYKKKIAQTSCRRTVYIQGDQN